MAALVDVTGDVAVDVETHRAFPLFARTPPEAEGYTCGLLFAGELGADGSVDVVIAEPREAGDIYLGDNADLTGGLIAITPTDNLAETVARLNRATLDAMPDTGLDLLMGEEAVTDGSSPYTSVTAPLLADDTLTDAILKVDAKLGEGFQAIADLEEVVDNLVFEAVAIPLGNDIATDDTGLWDEGAVALDAQTSTGEAVSLINQRLKGVADTVDALDGFNIVMGDIATDGDGSWAGGAVPLTDEMPVSEGIDRLNEVLGKLIPSQPPQFPNGTLSVSNTAGSSPRLADGYTYNGGAVMLAGTAVTRIVAAGVSSNTFGDVGPGDTGTLAASLNEAVVGSRALTGTGDNGTYSGLVIADQKDFPVSTPGFWKSLDVSLNLLAVPVGLNGVQISHSAGDATNVATFMRDDMTSSPVISAGSVAEAALGTPAYSSSVPHYGTGGQLTVAMSIANLAGETYYGGADPIQFSGPVITTKTFTYAPATGIDAPLARNTLSAQAVTPQTIAVDGTGHLSGKVSGVARNVNGSVTTDLGGPTVLIKRGAAGARIDENSVSALDVTAVRKGQADGAAPAGVPAAWVSSDALAAHEAAVVAGVLKHDQTNYSAGYLPAGPDLSTGRAGAQYVTFSFSKAALSGFKINVTGTYADCRIRLPGASDAAPNAPNGWWDAFKAYDGAGVPGETGDTDAGCALGAVMSGGSGTFQITFGTESSTNATGNEILVRFRLNAGQSISALSFSA